MFKQKLLILLVTLVGLAGSAQAQSSCMPAEEKAKRSFYGALTDEQQLRVWNDRIDRKLPSQTLTEPQRGLIAEVRRRMLTPEGLVALHNKDSEMLRLKERIQYELPAEVTYALFSSLDRSDLDKYDTDKRFDSELSKQETGGMSIQNDDGGGFAKICDCLVGWYASYCYIVQGWQCDNNRWSYYCIMVVNCGLFWDEYCNGRCSPAT